VEGFVMAQRDRYGITEPIGEDAAFAHVDGAVEAFRARTGATGG
jgi:hypothetical protein